VETPPLIDPAAIARLQRLGDNAFVCRMIDLFLEYCATKIDEARSAYSLNNLVGVAKAAHPIKSSAGNLGVHRLQQLAQTLEITAENGLHDQAGELLTQLELAFAAAKPDLQHLRTSLDSTPPNP
jgi:HPt (histidine-containing phosphotransfer) domain-containing protein